MNIKTNIELIVTTLKRYHIEIDDKTSEEIEEMSGEELYEYCNSDNLVQEIVDDIDVSDIIEIKE